ncbi:helix-turn-helix transcriptional regulator [Streptomyces flavotricini]|uniref:Helix-turn-helix transcriptional regulator n=1 Tax=Streptomyces flavotricini TaxID=66888 RepID=A0ABS8E0X7_9ACTN|nr:helix-turn-helix transcriptional regulator [Streptomyces flavotricini]MCC0094613.1 helix-turn-helix transcriptional regulator [Streptomyces flavotricini]
MAGRPSTATTLLTPAQLRIAAKVALGMSSAQVAAKLGLSKATVDVQMSDSNTKTGVTSRTALIHTCYVTGQLPLPEAVAPAPSADEVEREILWGLALGAELAETGRRCHYSADAVGKRLRDLKKRWMATNDPQLITLGWQYGVLDASRGCAGFATRSNSRR